MSNIIVSTLTDALEISIQRIISSEFEKDWLLLDNNKTSNVLHNSDISLKSDEYNSFSKPNYHEFTEICLCITGNFILRMGDYFYEMKEGRAGLILPGLIHSEIAIKNHNYMVMWLVIDVSKARLHLSGSREGEFFTSDLFFLKHSHEYNLLLNRIKNENQSRENYFEETIKACLLKMYIIALREVRFDEYVGTHYSTWKEYVVSEIIDFINKSHLSHIKLRDISKEVCISENHVNNIFKSVTGLTIMQYIENLRISKAKQLLKDPTLTINLISSQLGYYDRYHFGKSFKKATGYSPGQYRKMEQDSTSTI
ncbi:MAG: AraC family transcriptional regulator [Clostridiaceae bacterium]|jgi:AraC-like DNA-binding protein|nr:AraC family transcriptional regulator [Clostridiaceae bacterium]